MPATTGRIDQELRISEEVAAETEECVSYVPANGKVIWVAAFIADAAFSQNSAVKLVWDLGGGGETVLWSVKGNHSLPFEIEITDADGVKKLGICLDNGEAGSLFMSGYAAIRNA